MSGPATCHKCGRIHYGRWTEPCKHCGWPWDTTRAASAGCVGTGDVDARCIPFVAWLRQMGFPHYELSAKGCTADEALRAEVS